MAKKIIHYTVGYGGNLNYATTCGKEIHSHSKTEDATIDPSKVTCKKCRENKIWLEDYTDLTNTSSKIKRRIYIESDVLHADELADVKDTVSDLCKDKKVKHVSRVFSDVLEYAWHDLEKTWAAVKKADEIYSNSSLLPLSGGTYTGAPAIFNGMCERAIKEGVTGKDVYILNSLKNVSWHMIDIPLMKNAFKKNNLFMYNDDYDITKVDVSKIKKP